MSDGDIGSNVGVGRSGRIIGKILPAAVRLWLRSQAEQIDSLEISLTGRDRDLLSGYLPSVSLEAEQAIYQGIHIGSLHLSAADIRINVGQVVRGKPLRLLRAFPVQGEVALTENDLNASLQSPLLAQGLTNFWRAIVQDPSVASDIKARYGALPMSADVQVSNAQTRIKENRLSLRFYPSSEALSAEQPIAFSTGLEARDGNCLQLIDPQWIESLDTLDGGEPIDSLQYFQWSLGSDVDVECLSVEKSQMVFKGQIMVNP